MCPDARANADDNSSAREQFFAYLPLAEHSLRIAANGQLLNSH
jgi:hypothetical protein